eukprot:CAMPEP_0197178028 /NCGR_PEP_ID=MMETSP1423-20130617/3426_1 /TAXON_ID=476441 /ORGANISM="Pseudo-nitzschia heimii, Strain UNC1101" /LENGTH=900 /DNA_ID=CAMNT_0042627673 /DNA_START=35 /DNA_END=2737 /DNA_ORIENTATION=-
MIETTIDLEDMETPSARDTVSSETTLPLSETNSSIEDKESVKLGLSERENMDSMSDTGTVFLLNGISTDREKDEFQIGSGEEPTMGLTGRITPFTNSDVETFPKKSDTGLDTGLDTVSNMESHRIEPEGTSPFLRMVNQRFDHNILNHTLSESLERQENGERKNLVRMDRNEREDILATTAGDVSVVGTNSHNNLKKTPREPPATQAHKRKTSETADEREQRIKDGTDRSEKELSFLTERRVDDMVLDNGLGINETYCNDEMSIKREPSGSTMTLNTLASDTWDKNSERGKPSMTEIQAIEVDKVETRYESPNRTAQRHNLNIHNSHNSHMKHHTSARPKTFNDNMHQNSDLTSPESFFLDDNESIPIPHLPPLVLPGIGPSYDTMSMQGQQMHLNHSGFQQQFHQLPSLVSQRQQQQQQSVLPIPNQVITMPGGKRKIHLHLWESVSSMMQPEPSRFLSFRRKKGTFRRPSQTTPISELSQNDHTSKNDKNESDINHWADRGTLTVSWYEGTNSLELQEHVQNSVIRKLCLGSTTKLLNFRVLDESSDPPEEIVLSPYIPNGSSLVVRFSIRDGGDLTPPKYTRFSDYNSGPPDSPSAAPSPYPTSVDLNGLGLNANQLALLDSRLKSLRFPQVEGTGANSRGKLQAKNGRKLQQSKQTQSEKKSSKDDEDEEDGSNSKESAFEVASLHPEDQIQKSLREITGLLLREREGRHPYVPRQEKRQVVFVLANYFVLFLSLIAISAELQARAPDWHAAMEQQLKNVHNCSKDKESLFTCVENGDMAGLVASVILWLSRSAATKRIFLLGFGSSNKLWTAVYESLVTAICWGFSYMFIRRGMNPDNNRDFLRRYWKDAVYGSLAGFNAAFMKQVLKNLIPQEAIEDALQERQLKILSWLPSIG